MHGIVHKKIVAWRCIDNQFRIESLTSESNRIVRCQEIPTPTSQHLKFRVLKPVFKA